MSSEALPPRRSRYGCQECREDAEWVLGGRATREVLEMHREHLERCGECRRVQRLLEEIYEGPAAPPPGPTADVDREFDAVMSNLSRGSTHRDPGWLVGLAMGGLLACAVGLTVPLVRGSSAEPDPGPSLATETWGPGPHASLSWGRPSIPDARTPGFRHAAQGYGRILGGGGQILAAPDGQPTHSNTFPIGTAFELGAEESLQVGLLGRIVANFSPRSRVVWESASPDLIEIRVESGIAAFRYDRRAEDPILHVRTPTAIVRVIGTVFTIEVDDSRDTLVSVLRGRVDVLDAENLHTTAEVESGYRYAVARATYEDVGKTEVQSALPLSIEVGPSPDPLDMPLSPIPTTWNVPGLPSEPSERVISNVPDRPRMPTKYVVPGLARAPSRRPALPIAETGPVEDEGDDLIVELMRDAAATHRKELGKALQGCRDLYRSSATRYRAAKCFSDFLAKYGNHDGASEAWALVGMLRMDYAMDYRAAEVALETYLRRAPDGQLAEIASYRLWLASVEDGRLRLALERGRRYLDRYPGGRFVGKIIQRFPTLKSEI